MLVAIGELRQQVAHQTARLEEFADRIQQTTADISSQVRTNTTDIAVLDSRVTHLEEALGRRGRLPEPEKPPAPWWAVVGGLAAGGGLFALIMEIGSRIGWGQ